jgi:hypothetical protein
MTLAARLAPLSNERREKSVPGTRAVVSSQQLMTASNVIARFPHFSKSQALQKV